MDMDNRNEILVCKDKGVLVFSEDWVGFYRDMELVRVFYGLGFSGLSGDLEVFSLVGFSGIKRDFAGLLRFRIGGLSGGFGYFVLADTKMLRD